MESKEGIDSSGVTLKGDEAPEGFHVAARSENTTQVSGSTAPEQPPAVTAAAPFTVASPPGTEVKKKRGRPRKYAPDGSVLVPLSPMPISASIPLTGDFSAWKPGKARPVDSFKKKHKLEFENIGERLAYSVGANFTPHVITVNTGEDITMKVISFSQQGSRAICILSANGAISNVTLRQPNSSGGTLTYEGRFEILSLSGSYILTDSGGTKSRSGGMSVTLAGPDGRVVGGGLAGLLIAAGPVQVVVASFIPGHHQEQKPKKPRFEHTVTFSTVPVNHTSREATEGGPCNGTVLKHTPPPSFHGDNSATPNSFPVSRNFSSANEISLSGAEPQDTTPQKCEVSC